MRTVARMNVHFIALVSHHSASLYHFHSTIFTLPFSLYPFHSTIPTLPLEGKKKAVKQIKRTTIPQLQQLLEAASQPSDELVQLEDVVSRLVQEVAGMQAFVQQERKSIGEEQEKVAQEHSSLEAAAKSLKEKLLQQRQLECSLQEDQLRVEKLNERISSASSSGQQNVEQVKATLEEAIRQSTEYIAKLNVSMPTEALSKERTLSLKAIESEIAQESNWLASNKPKAESNQFVCNQRSNLLVEKTHAKEQIRKIESQMLQLFFLFLGFPLQCS